MPKFKLKKGKKHYWKKSLKRKGGNTFNDTLLTEDDVIVCEPCELGNAIEKFDEVKEDKIEPKYGYKMEKLGTNEYNVVSLETNESINTKVLSLEEARTLIRESKEKDADVNED
jgi:hypothetical protein